MKDELVRIWKELFIVFVVLFGLREIAESHSHDCQCPAEF